MSPEQAEGGDVGPASDVFSLGAVLAFAATGEGPFGTGSTAALIYRVVHAEPDLDRCPTDPAAGRALPGQGPAAPADRGRLLAELGTRPAGGPIGRPVRAAAAGGRSAHPPTEQVGPGLLATDSAARPDPRADQPETAVPGAQPETALPGAQPEQPCLERSAGRPPPLAGPGGDGLRPGGRGAGAFVALRFSQPPALAPAAHHAAISHHPQRASRRRTPRMARAPARGQAAARAPAPARARRTVPAPVPAMRPHRLLR